MQMARAPCSSDTTLCRHSLPRYHGAIRPLRQQCLPLLVPVNHPDTGEQGRVRVSQPLAEQVTATLTATGPGSGMTSCPAGARALTCLPPQVRAIRKPEAGALPSPLDGSRKGSGLTCLPRAQTDTGIMRELS
jgi:hypothetical protein